MRHRDTPKDGIASTAKLPLETIRLNHLTGDTFHATPPFLGAALVPLLATAVPALALEKVPYSDGLYKELLTSGKPFMLEFSTSW